MEVTIPIVCLGSCSANVCPHTFGKEGFFSNRIQNIKLVLLAVYITPFPSQSNKTLPNTCFASEPCILSFHGPFGNFPVGLISLVHLYSSRNN